MTIDIKKEKRVKDNKVVDKIIDENTYTSKYLIPKAKSKDGKDLLLTYSCVSTTTIQNIQPIHIHKAFVGLKNKLKTEQELELKEYLKRINMWKPNLYDNGKPFNEFLTTSFKVFKKEYDKAGRISQRNIFTKGDMDAVIPDSLKIKGIAEIRKLNPKQ